MTIVDFSHLVIFEMDTSKREKQPSKYNFLLILYSYFLHNYFILYSLLSCQFQSRKTIFTWQKKKQLKTFCIKEECYSYSLS